ncbi:MAG: LuxR C-terminal-related transcriptional regulator [Caldilineaceae bacterium]
MRQSLPIPSTSLVGRDLELAATATSMRREDVRLLTLTGPPGIGKTRLALAAAAVLHREFVDGVYFVNLAPVSDADLVLPTIAHTIGHRPASARPLIQELQDYLANRRVLLVLDNFEQVVAAAPAIAELLEAAQGVKILVTSRELLRIAAEHNFPVPPLPLPPVLADQGTPRTLAVLPPERLSGYAAVQLFVARAVALHPDFVLTPDNALIVAGICCRLDGLPLAIELAAARVRHISVSEIYARLTNPLQILTDGTRDLPLRQRTLRNTIAWSYNLLADDEKRLLSRLAVFRGGCSLEAAETVGGSEAPGAVFDALASLVDKSLVQRIEPPDGTARFILLAVIHEYAREQLVEGGELEDLSRSHALYFAELAERAEVEMRRAQQKIWFHLLETEIDNLRAALAWSVGSDIALGIRIISGTLLHWHIYGRQDEGIRWTQQLLASIDEAPKGQQARLLRSAAHLISYRDTSAAIQLGRQAVAVARSHGDKAQLAWALYGLGALTPPTVDEQDSLPGSLAEAEALFRELEDKPGLAHVLNSIGEFARVRGEDERAWRAYAASLDIFAQLGDRRAEYTLLYNLGFIAQHEGDHREAIRLLRRSLELCQELGVPAEVARELLALAGSLGVVGDPAGAARLFGAADAFLQQSGALLDPDDLPEHERNLGIVRAALGDEHFDVTWAEGAAMALEEAAEYACAAADAALSTASGSGLARVPAAGDALTRREREVAHLIADGLSNRDIAAALVVTERTIEGHVSNILGKLGFHSRTQIAAWVVANLRVSF